MGKVEGRFGVTISEIVPLQSPLAAIQRLLERFGNQGVIIGGVAASVLGTPRLTADVDVVLLLSMSRLPELLGIAAELGLVPRIADAEQFARRNRVVLLRHEEIGISMEIAARLYEDAISLVRSSVRHRDPNICPDDLEYEVRRRVLPRGLAELTELARRARGQPRA